jgi:tetratricopeptide (TPR) repeat protein
MNPRTSVALVLPWFFCGAILATQKAFGEESEAPQKDTPRPEDSLRRGDYEEAVEGFKKVLGAGGPLVARGLVDALVAQGKYDEARRAIESVPGHEKSPALLLARGRLHLVRGQLAEAEAAFRSALKTVPESVEALNRLGETLWKRGRRTEAEGFWNEVVEVYQRMSYEDAEQLSAALFVEMGLALIGLNRFAEANSVMLSSARDQDPADPSLLLESGRIFMQKYDYPESRNDLRDAVDQNPRFADALVALADNYLTDFQVGTKRYDRAEESIRRALDVNPNHAGAYLMRGTLQISDGYVERAATDFRKSIELDPSSMRARGMLGACLFLQADEAALKKAEVDALAINPRSAEFFHTIALTIERQFRYKEAVHYAGRALEVDSDYWPAFATLGINCLRTGQEERGREFLEKAWENDNFNPWVLNTRVLLRHMDRHFRELKTERFVFKFRAEDFEVLKTYLVPLLEEAYARLSAHYKTQIPTPIYIEVFSHHKWFSARTVGLEGFPASGACFGNLVTLTTPRALPQNWGAVAWHEFAHVVTLALTHHRVPRWLTEGLSVFEEGHDRPGWKRNFERDIADTFISGRLLSLAQLDFGFSKPKYPNQILISYFQGCLIVQYIKEKWSFDTVLSILAGYRDNKSTRDIFKDVLGLTLEEFDRQFFEYVAAWVKQNGYDPNVSTEHVIGVLKPVADADPENVEKLVDLAWGYLTSGINPVDAPITASKVLELDPKNGDAHAILGLHRYREKKLAGAKEALERALELKTRFQFRVHVALGRIALKDGDKAGAAKLLRKAKEISPRAGATFPPGKNLYYELADLYLALGEEDVAFQQLEELSSFASEESLCRQRLVNHYMQVEGEEALVKARDALVGLLYLNPFEISIHEFLASVAAKLGDHDITIREYEYLLSFPGTDPLTAYLALAKAYAAKREEKKAKECARKVLGLDKGNREAQQVLEELQNTSR